MPLPYQVQSGISKFAERHSITYHANRGSIHQHNIKIYTIGVGEDIDAVMLEKIALESGAKSFLAKDIKKLKEVYEEIDGFEKSTLKSKEYAFKEFLFFYPASLAFALLFFYFYLFLRRAI